MIVGQVVYEMGYLLANLNKNCKYDKIEQLNSMGQLKFWKDILTEVLPIDYFEVILEALENILRKAREEGTAKEQEILKQFEETKLYDQIKQLSEAGKNDGSGEDVNDEGYEDVDDEEDEETEEVEDVAESIEARAQALLTEYFKEKVTQE